MKNSSDRESGGQEKPKLKSLLYASTAGLSLVISTFVGLAMGYGLDRLFGGRTSPWFTIIFLFLGIISGFRDLFRVASKQDDGNSKKNH